MPTFKVNIDREVTTYDRFTRYIEAETAEAAEAIGYQLALLANMNCPDDAHDSGHDPELDGWFVNGTEVADPMELLAAPEHELHESILKENE